MSLYTHLVNRLTLWHEFRVNNFANIKESDQHYLDFGEEVLFPSRLWCRDGNRSGRPAPVGLPVGSRFFDRPVKPVEKPVEFSFLATKRHLSTNRNVLIYFIINKTLYKTSVLTNHTFRKHLLNGFKL